mmetsp:Transcript_25880/g.56077  ORF Transcript_25880/g.56077 Transcript_25880/m.56077 type:complete len:227 (-) Transcript_25880:555-1235(-)
MCSLARSKPSFASRDTCTRCSRCSRSPNVRSDTMLTQVAPSTWLNLNRTLSTLRGVNPPLTATRLWPQSRLPRTTPWICSKDLHNHSLPCRRQQWTTPLISLRALWCLPLPSRRLRRRATTRGRHPTFPRPFLKCRTKLNRDLDSYGSHHSQQRHSSTEASAQISIALAVQNCMQPKNSQLNPRNPRNSSSSSNRRNCTTFEVSRLVNVVFEKLVTASGRCFSLAA